MLHPYKFPLLILMFIIPFFIISHKNRFNRSTHTALRFLMAVLAVWAYVILVRVIVQAVDPLLADTPELRQKVYDGDGAKNVAALLFGWIYGLVSASFTWLLARGWWWYKTRATI